MSNVQAEEVAKILLNPDQVEKIIAYAGANQLYEGTPPVEPERRLNDAATLVWQARRAHANGNNSPQVVEICFLADVDQGPRASAT